ncbi:MAG TPA: OmpH family outer membrane protein [Thermoanaerobaculia bacterium]|nr:OmpH family outer membrane protein [Thermoanaerobaculia bacterium]
MRRRLAIIALIAIASSVFLFAQTASRPVKVAVIDTEKILINSAAGKKALADLKKLQESRAETLRKRGEELRALQKQITDGRLTLSPEKLDQLGKQYEDKEIAVRRLQDDANRELNKTRDDAVAKVDASVMPVINAMGKELGYTLIFRKFESGLIYADEAVDITDVVIRRLDATSTAPATKK